MPDHSNSTSSSATVLLLSRDADTRILVRSVLFHRGHLVLEAKDEENAIAVCTMMRGEIDLIIVDAPLFQPSSWSGWHLRTPNLVLLLDAKDAPLDYDVVGGRLDYLKRPFTADDITLKVRSALDSRKPRKKVLLVDDDASLRRMLSAVLEAAGYEVVQASNGKEALNRPDTLEAAIILTEIVMPEVEGLQLIQELLKVKPCLKIISMSGVECAEGYLYIARRLGAKGSITKPVNIGELLQLLDELLSNN
jgi:DNA-binding response OmpR family regulator